MSLLKETVVRLLLLFIKFHKLLSDELDEDSGFELLAFEFVIALRANRTRITDFLSPIPSSKLTA